MARQSEQLEREAEETRHHLAGALDELRYRVSPGQVVDQLADYVSEGPGAIFMRNLTREIRDNPVPVLLIGIGIAWLVLASSLSARGRGLGSEPGTALMPRRDPAMVHDTSCSAEVIAVDSRLLLPADA